jgi:SpoVK/Ycf46/Vps4 family AAA+-type ATPase
MRIIENAKDHILFGYPKQKKVMRQILTKGVNDPHIILQHGPPGTGKTQTASYWYYLAPRGKLVYICCNHEIIAGSFQDSINRIESLLENRDNSSSFLLIFLDEVDAVGTRRKEITIENMTAVHRIMALIGSVNEKKSVAAVFCTNCPNLLDDAISLRCQEVIYIPQPAYDELFEAFLSSGYTRELAKEVSEIWVTQMQTYGFWSGRQLIPIISRCAFDLRKNRAKDIVEKLDKLVPGARIFNPSEYAKENDRWIIAADRTFDRWYQKRRKFR